MQDFFPKDQALYCGMEGMMMASRLLILSGLWFVTCAAGCHLVFPYESALDGGFKPETNIVTDGGVDINLDPPNPLCSNAVSYSDMGGTGLKRDPYKMKVHQSIFLILFLSFR